MFYRSLQEIEGFLLSLSVNLASTFIPKSINSSKKFKMVTKLIFFNVSNNLGTNSLKELKQMFYCIKWTFDVNSSISLVVVFLLERNLQLFFFRFDT